MLLLIKGTKTVSQILARILVRLYFVFLSFNYIVVIAQIIARLAGLSLTFPWQPGATGIGFYSSRLCGLMGEPEHLGLISVGLIFTKKDDRKEFLLSLFSIIVLIISFSATSWVIALLIFFSLIQKLKRRSIVLIILIMLFVLLFARNMPGYARIISAASLADNSSFVRVAKGIAVYIDLDLPMKLLGTGPGDASVYKSLYSGSLYGRIQAGDNFINGLFSELLSFGMIASIILNYIYFVIIGGRKEWTYFMAFTILRLGTSINCSNPFLPLILLPMLSEIQRAKTCDN